MTLSVVLVNVGRGNIWQSSRVNAKPAPAWCECPSVILCLLRVRNQSLGSSERLPNVCIHTFFSSLTQSVYSRWWFTVILQGNRNVTCRVPSTLHRSCYTRAQDHLPTLVLKRMVLQLYFKLLSLFYLLGHFIALPKNGSWLIIAHPGFPHWGVSSFPFERCKSVGIFMNTLVRNSLHGSKKRRGKHKRAQAFISQQDLIYGRARPRQS